MSGEPAGPKALQRAIWSAGSDVVGLQFGPMVMARKVLDAERYDALRGDLRALVAEVDAGDGELRLPAEYLLVVGLKP